MRLAARLLPAIIANVRPLNHQLAACFALESYANDRKSALTNTNGREVVMKTPLLTVLIVIALSVATTVTVKKACKTGRHAWCVPASTWHHAKARAPV